MFFRIIFLWVFLHHFLFACGGGFWPEDYEFKFLHKRDYAFSNIQDNLNFSSTYNNIVMNSDKEAKKENLKEWQKEFGKQYSLKQIEEFLYEGKNLSSIKNKEIRAYIDFVNLQAPFVTSWRNYYLKYGYKGRKLKESDVDLLISKAISNIQSTKSKYLKQRYFFLALRLAHYYNKDNAYSIYTANKNLLQGSDSIVKDWIQGLYAGILIKNGENVKGVYEFTKLFDKSKSNWYLAFYNFNAIKTDKDWNDLVSLAKDKDEKIKFLTLRALDANANIVEELKNIAKIDLNSKNYDLLLFREVLKSQDFFNIYPKDSYYEVKPKNIDKYTPLVNYLQTVSKDNMYTVDLALAYFSFYKGDISSSKDYLQKAYKEVKGDDIHELNALGYIIYLNGLKTINTDIENNIATRLDKLMTQKCNKDSIFKYTFYKVKDLYKEKGDEFKYFIASNYRYLNINSINLEKYEKIEELKNKKDKSGLEKYMLEKIIFKYKDFDKSLQKAYFSILMNNLEFEKLLKEYPNKLNYKLRFNIFNNLIAGNNRRVSPTQITLKETLEKIIKIKENLKKNPNDAMSNYLYATALYNLSYWGNSNTLTTIYRSSYSFKEKELELRKINLSNKYLNRALENSTNKEFKAKVTYMLAKNELALYDIKNSTKSEYNQEISYRTDNWYSFGYDFKNIQRYMVSGYGKYFDKLKNDFDDTSYYQELIKECSNLRNYQSTLKKVYDKDALGISLTDLEKELSTMYKQKKTRIANKYNTIFFWKLMVQEPITNKTVESYNNIAYYLEKLHREEYSVLLLKKILEKYPNRVVAYYNLGDAYWSHWKKDKAKSAYKKYIELMIKEGKEKKIPQKVKDRVDIKD